MLCQGAPKSTVQRDSPADQVIDIAQLPVDLWIDKHPIRAGTLSPIGIRQVRHELIKNSRLALYQYQNDYSGLDDSTSHR